MSRAVTRIVFLVVLGHGEVVPPDDLTAEGKVILSAGGLRFRDFERASLGLGQLDSVLCAGLTETE